MFPFVGETNISKFSKIFVMKNFDPPKLLHISNKNEHSSYQALCYLSETLPRLNIFACFMFQTKIPNLLWRWGLAIRTAVTAPTSLTSTTTTSSATSASWNLRTVVQVRFSRLWKLFWSIAQIRLRWGKPYRSDMKGHLNCFQSYPDNSPIDIKITKHVGTSKYFTLTF